MSSEVEVRPEAPARRFEPPNPKTDDWALVLPAIGSLAEKVAHTEFVPSALRGKPPAIAACILYGRELNMPPMQALQNVHIIEGRPSLAAEHMRAMVLEAGHELWFGRMDGGVCEVYGRRRRQDGTFTEATKVTWTIGDAKLAGLVNPKKPNWLRYPRRMLQARASGEIIDLIFADVTHGLVVREVAEDEADTDGVVPVNEPPKTTEKVSRAKKRVASAPAAGVGTAETPAPAATPTAPDSVSPPEVPLPGEELPADSSTPGEGLTHPAGSSATPAEYINAEIVDVPLPGEEDLPAPVSEGDGSPDDVAATGTDASYMEQRFRHAQEAAGGPVEENDPPIPGGMLRALGAAFTSLKVTDKAERLHTTSALLGRRIESWTHLSRSDGNRLFKAIDGVDNREQLEELIQRAAEEWGRNGTP